jgi:ABC-type dipeptide/oligopeptide/nickel transport system permease subunit
VPAATRTPLQLAYSRFRRDRLSFLAAFVFAAIVIASFAGGATASALLGHNGTDAFPYAANVNQKPVGPWTRVPASHNSYGYANGDLAPPPKNAPRTLLIFGADGPLGRDEFIRVVDGGKASLEIALGGVLIALLIGLPLGGVSGYFGGFTDTLVSRVTETVMSFPLLLFLVFASVNLDYTLKPIGAWGSIIPEGVVAEAMLIGVFTSFYPTRLVRARLLTLRREEFVEAAEMVGASHWRILYRHLLPYLRPTLLVWAAIATATNILLEVGLSFIGAGVQPETPTWGSLLSTTWGTIFQPQVFQSVSFTVWQTVFPTVAILLCVVSLNQLSEGLRHALEPQSGR